MGKKISGAQKRKKKREKEELALEMERLKLGPTKIWTGLVVHHKDVFVSHVIPKLNETDRCFFSEVNRESRGVLAYAGVDVSKLGWLFTNVHPFRRWNGRGITCLGERKSNGRVIDQAWFCEEVAATNKLEFLKWAREVKHCEWDEETITMAADKGNLEMLKYCFSNDCPYDEEESCKQAAAGGHLDCVRFLFDKVEPSRETEEKAAHTGSIDGHIDILKYFVEERKIPDDGKGQLRGKRCSVWSTRLPQILSRRGESAS